MAIGLSLSAAFLLGACSSRQIYDSGQAWQRNECQKLNDKAERDICLANSSSSYETYKKQSESTKKD
jgi:hypothetical protein